MISITIRFYQNERLLFNKRVDVASHQISNSERTCKDIQDKRNTQYPQDDLRAMTFRLVNTYLLNRDRDNVETLTHLAIRDVRFELVSSAEATEVPRKFDRSVRSFESSVVVE